MTRGDTHARPRLLDAQYDVDKEPKVSPTLQDLHGPGHTEPSKGGFQHVDDRFAGLLPFAAAHPTRIRPVGDRSEAGGCGVGQTPAAVTTPSVANPRSRPSRTIQVVSSFIPARRATASSSMTT